MNKLHIYLLYYLVRFIALLFYCITWIIANIIGRPFALATDVLLNYCKRLWEWNDL